MNQQKAWFLQRAAAHRAAVLGEASSAKPLAHLIEKDPRHVAKSASVAVAEAAKAAGATESSAGVGASSEPAGSADKAPMSNATPAGGTQEAAVAPEGGAASASPPDNTSAVDVSDGTHHGDDGLSAKLRELSLAGGDLAALGALAAGDSRTDLTTALKALGFKGLRTRQEMEAELKTWHAAHK